MAGNGWYFCKKCNLKFCLDLQSGETIDQYWQRVRNTNRARCKNGHICDPCKNCSKAQ